MLFMTGSLSTWCFWNVSVFVTGQVDQGCEDANAS